MGKDDYYYINNGTPPKLYNITENRKINVEGITATWVSQKDIYIISNFYIRKNVWGTHSLAHAELTRLLLINLSIIVYFCLSTF